MNRHAFTSTGLTVIKYVLFLALTVNLQNLLSSWLGPYTAWPVLLYLTVFFAITKPITQALSRSMVLAGLHDLYFSQFFGFSLILWPCLVLIIARVCNRYFSHRSIYTMIIMSYLAAVAHFMFYRFWSNLFAAPLTPWSVLNYILLFITAVISLTVIKQIWTYFTTYYANYDKPKNR